MFCHSNPAHLPAASALRRFMTLRRTISQLNSTEKMSTAVESERPLLTSQRPDCDVRQVLIEVRLCFSLRKSSVMWYPPQGELYAPRLEPLLDRFAFLARTLLDPADQFV
jgi:hypothetical protein